MAMMMVTCHNLMIVVKMMPHHLTHSCEVHYGKYNGLSPSDNCYDNEVSPKELSGCKEGATGKSAKRRMWGICHHMMGTVSVVGGLYNAAGFAGRCVTISSRVTTPFSAKCWLRRSYSIEFLENKR